MSNYFLDVFHGVQDYGWHILWVSMLLSGAELVFGRNRYSLQSRVKAMLFWFSYILITVMFFAVFNKFWASLGIQPLLRLDLSAFPGSTNPVVSMMGLVITPILGGISAEFFYYWFHRLQHSNRFMWAFHREHHALREMSAWNSAHHCTEEIFRIPFITLPMALLFHMEIGPVPLFMSVLMGMQGQFEHSHTRLNLGALRYVVADNCYHRIHHSLEERHWNKNFGSFTSVWDNLFGTAYFPAKNEWPDTGLAELDEPKTLSEYLFRPWKKVLGMVR